MVVIIRERKITSFSVQYIQNEQCKLHFHFKYQNRFFGLIDIFDGKKC